MSSSPILPISFIDKHALFKSYMPFIENGGLFVATTLSFELGDEVVLLIQLCGEAEKLPVTGKIVWSTIVSHAHRPQGVGVQFVSVEASIIRKKIETILSGSEHNIMRDTM